jgi:A/G-specific adenine glycosylase
MDTLALARWYRTHRRAMPWRSLVSPYRTLVSEVMLQQTRVDTVIPYFERFMTRFPTVEDLAGAPLELVLEAWSGLGYYRRARMLQRTAQAIVASGAFPETLDGLRALPGVGPYTAAAVGSIALGLDVPLVDGNVERVLCRHDARAVVPKREAKALWARAGELVADGLSVGARAGELNQALMELGATVCTPQRPNCLLCPVRPTCAGVASPESFPRKAAKAVVPGADATAWVVRADGAVLLARRTGEGLLGGLWEPPMRAGAGDPGDPGLAVARMVHVFSHLRLRVEVRRADAADAERCEGIARAGAPGPGVLPYDDVRWVPVAEADGLALSTLARKVMRAAGVGVSGPPGRAGEAPP